MSFFQELQQRNKWLYITGCTLFSFGIISLGFLLFDNRYVDGISLWILPFRYSIGSGVYVFTLGWLSYLINDNKHRNWITFFLSFISIGFLAIILIQLLNGKIAFLNDQNPFDHLMNQLSLGLTSLFLLFQIIVTIIFYRQRKNIHSQHYTWGVRMGMLTFAIFSILVFGFFIFVFDDLYALLELYKNKKGIGLDTQIAFYMGIHSVQIIPLLSYYLFDQKKQVVLFTFSYITLILVLFISFLLRIF